MPVWMTIVLALGGSALISASVNLVFNLIVNSAKRKCQTKKEIADEIEARNEITRRGVQALLRHELYDMYNYWNRVGYAPLDAKNDFENLYSSYHNLGRNGVMDGIHQRFMELPDETPKKQRLAE